VKTAKDTLEALDSISLIESYTSALRIHISASNALLAASQAIDNNTFQGTPADYQALVLAQANATTALSAATSSYNTFITSVINIESYARAAYYTLIIKDIDGVNLTLPTNAGLDSVLIGLYPSLVATSNIAALTASRLNFEAAELRSQSLQSDTLPLDPDPEIPTWFPNGFYEI
jgi:hypothetical protein